MVSVESLPSENERVRLLQASSSVRKSNYEKMLLIGAYNLLKVTDRKGPLRTAVSGYVTLLPALSGETPTQMEVILGLRKGDLALGAYIYRLTRLPELEGFLPRGYSTLVDGLPLPDGAAADAAGYRPGLGAWQITLLEPIPVSLVATLKPDEPFKPGLHPRTQAMYRT